MIPINDANELEVNRINEEIRRMEEEAEALREQREAAARLQEARSRRDLEQRRLQRVVGQYDQAIGLTTEERWRVSGIATPVTTPTADEITSEEFDEPKQEEPKVELLKVDTAMFVFAWENSSSVEEVTLYDQELYGPDYQGGISEDDIRLTKEIAKMIRTVEKIPLRELPDTIPMTTIRRGRIQNFS